MKFWCSTAFMKSDELVEVAKMLDQAGYHGVMVSDHVVYPKDLQSKYPYSPHPDGRPIWEPETSWPDTWVLIGAMIGATTNLHFSNNVFIAPNRPILLVAKQVATAAVLSGNRVEFGLSAGWMKEEFDLIGTSFENRGPRLNEMIQALRELWKGGWVEWHGEYYDIPPLTLEPAPTEPIPIYCGGHTNAALRRAARYCDGWVGNAYTWADAEHYVGKLKGMLREEGREHDPFEIVIGLYEMPSVDIYRRAEEELGVTGMLCMPWAGMQAVSGGAHSGLTERADAYRRPIEQFAEAFVHRLQ